LIHRLHIKNDDRPMFKIETFGFVPGGYINISMSGGVVLASDRQHRNGCAGRISAWLTRLAHMAGFAAFD
jgi:hypothetical protein